MRAQDIDEAAVLALARLVDLELGKDELAAVLANLKRTALIAEPVLALDLDTRDEIAPVWRL